MIENRVLEAVLEAVGMGPGAATPPERNAATAAFFDTLGVMAAGVSSDTVANLAKTQFSEPVGRAGVHKWLFEDSVAQRELPEWLLLAGTAAHALDFDDVLEPMNGHPSAVLVPLVWGLGRSLEAEGSAILDAYIVGVRACGAVAAHVDVKSAYARGWHATSVIGVLAAAVAAGRLLRLSESEMVHALGIAASLACGIRQNFGTDTKPLHVGVAARSGYEAAWWARCGITSSATALDGEYGWAALIGARETGRVGTCGTATKPLHDPGLDQKPYPCCYNTQRLATAGVRAHGLIDGRTVESIDATVETGATGPLIYEDPTTGLEAKFSAHYVLAEAVLEGDLPLTSFTDEYIATAASRRLIPRVSVTEKATHRGRKYAYPNGFAHIVVRLAGGDEVEVTERVPWGHHLNPMDSNALKRKMQSSLDYSGMSRAGADRLVRRIESMVSAYGPSTAREQGGEAE